MARMTELMDTTLRDGEQTHNVSFTPEEKLQLARFLLERVHIDRIEVGSARVSRGEEQGVRRITEWASGAGLLPRVEILGFVDGGKTLDWMERAGATVLNLLTKGSLNHLQYQLRRTPEAHQADIAATVQSARDRGIAVNVYLEDWSNGWRDSRDYVLGQIDFLTRQPVDRIFLPDTLGVMYPSEVYAAINDLVVRFPETRFQFHPHNDYGLGTINALEAVRAGAHGVHVTVNCLGERTGNASLAEVVINLHDHLGILTNAQESSLFQLSRLVETFSGKRLAHNTPIVGEDVFTQTAGVHADGDRKGGLYESRLSPVRFGRKRAYSLGKLAGKASLEQNLHSLGWDLSEEERARVLARIIEMGDEKITVTAEDLPFIISDVLQTAAHSQVNIQNVVITSGLHLKPVCSLAITYREKTERFAAAGDGGYDAFWNCLQEWARTLAVKLPALSDYEVRIPPGGRTSALVECKITWRRDDSTVFTTRGLDADQIMAAIEATSRMLNLTLND